MCTICGTSTTVTIQVYMLLKENKCQGKRECVAHSVRDQELFWVVSVSTPIELSKQATEITQQPKHGNSACHVGSAEWWLSLSWLCCVVWIFYVNIFCKCTRSQKVASSGW